MNPYRLDDRAIRSGRGECKSLIGTGEAKSSRNRRQPRTGASRRRVAHRQRICNEKSASVIRSFGLNLRTKINGTIGVYEELSSADSRVGLLQQRYVERLPHMLIPGVAGMQMIARVPLKQHAVRVRGVLQQFIEVHHTVERTARAYPDVDCELGVIGALALPYPEVRQFSSGEFKKR